MEETQPKHYTMDMNEPEVQEELPKSTRKCFRPPFGTSKEELMQIHRLKMQMKKARNNRQRPTGFGLPIRENKRDRSNDGSESNSAEQTLSNN